tara:strand:+ start:157 stop:363 length:207 start_codon:yes stop_codon:yes gene_type:complete
MLNAITSVLNGYIKILCAPKKISHTEVIETSMWGYRCIKHKEQGANPNTYSDIKANNIIVKETAPREI